MEVNEFIFVLGQWQSPGLPSISRMFPPAYAEEVGLQILFITSPEWRRKVAFVLIPSMCERENSVLFG